MVYHTIVASLVRKNFDAINVHDYASVLQGCDPNITHQFGGDHALGGRRHTTAVMGAWLERLGRVMPGLKLKVEDVWVKGWPWNTTAFVRWSATDTYPSGAPYANRGVHVIHMAWGKVDSIDAHEDSQAVQRVLDARRAAGMEEAGAAPLVN